MTYIEVVDYIDQIMRERHLKSGSRLPSVRNLCKQLGCSKETVLHAYHRLEELHQIYIIPQSGYYLLAEKPEEEINPEVLDFRTVNPDIHMLPYREFQHSVNQAVEIYRNELFLYGETKGITSLREVLKKQLENAQVFTSSEQIFVTNGAQQALYILFQMSYPNRRKKILIEQPTYGLVNRMLEERESQFIGIERTEQGVDLKELESIFQTQEIAFFYCIPRNHNPLGTNLTNGRKQAIVNLANRYNVYIIEDDYLSDINREKKDLPMHYYDTEGRVIYVKSFAKVFLPSVRLGIAVLPMDCCDLFNSVKRRIDLNTSQLDQAALEIFIRSGMYDRHIEKVKKANYAKIHYLEQFIQSLENKNVHFTVDESGYFIWIQWNQSMKEGNLVERLKNKGVLVVGGENYYFQNKVKKDGIRLCIANCEREKVCRGIQIIISEIELIQSETERKKYL